MANSLRKFGAYLLVLLCATNFVESGNKAQQPIVSVYHDDFTEELKLGESNPVIVFPQKITYKSETETLTDVMRVS